MIPSADHSSDHYPGIEMTIVPSARLLSYLAAAAAAHVVAPTVPLHSSAILGRLSMISSPLQLLPLRSGERGDDVGRRRAESFDHFKLGRSVNELSFHDGCSSSAVQSG